MGGWFFRNVWLVNILLLDYTIIKLILPKVKIKTIKTHKSFSFSTTIKINRNE